MGARAGVKSRGHSIKRFIRKRDELCANIYTEKEVLQAIVPIAPRTGQVKSSMLKVYSFLDKTFREVRLTFVTNF